MVARGRGHEAEGRGGDDVRLNSRDASKAGIVFGQLREKACQ